MPVLMQRGGETRRRRSIWNGVVVELGERPRGGALEAGALEADSGHGRGGLRVPGRGQAMRAVEDKREERDKEKSVRCRMGQAVRAEVGLG